jgi:hypothetical protein
MTLQRRPEILVAAAVLALGVTCAGPSSQEIGRERAIQIARAHVPFQPDSIDAERVMTGSRPVWRVTFRGRLPGQPPGLFETAVVEVDLHTGEVVSIART